MDNHSRCLIDRIAICYPIYTKPCCQWLVGGSGANYPPGITQIDVTYSTKFIDFCRSFISNGSSNIVVGASHQTLTSVKVNLRNIIDSYVQSSYAVLAIGY